LTTEADFSGLYLVTYLTNAT